MRLLLDTHAFLWWLDGDRKLPRRARELIGDESHDILVSAATAWEISTKARIGKLPGAIEVAADIARAVTSQGFLALPVSIPHAQAAGALPGPLRDPFDRMLIAQARLDNLELISNEAVFDTYRVRRGWA